MTWSIVTRDPATGAFAVAVATKNFAVGATVPHLRAGVGAVATQSFSNRYLGPASLDGMQRGLDPETAMAGAIATDAGRGLRQVHAVDRFGRTAAWTGENCVLWCGSVAGSTVSVAGNMLANERVVAATLDAYTSRSAVPLPERLALPERLVAAMQAGEAAGGDRRGRQSAALVLTTTEDFPDINIRVDDHAEPLAELERLLTIWRRDREPGLANAPSKANPAGGIDLDAIDAAWIKAGRSPSAPLETAVRPDVRGARCRGSCRARARTAARSGSGRRSRTCWRFPPTAFRIAPAGRGRC